MQPIHNAPVPKIAPRPSHPAVARACAYLQSHLGRTVPLNELARASFSSKYHLNRIFHRCVGMTPVQYHTHIRLGRARELLEAGQSPSYVAYATGFADQSHLSRTFKAAFGMPPGRYVASVLRGSAFGAPVLVDSPPAAASPAEAPVLREVA